MGTAKSIYLCDEFGEPDGFTLELRRLLDGALILRVCDFGQRAGIGIPASTSVSDIASALATSAELCIETRAGQYCFRRERSAVRFAYRSHDGQWDRHWTMRISDLVSALSDVCRRAA